MSCVRTPHRLRRSLVLSSPEELFFPASEWMPATGITQLDLLLNLASLAGQGEVKPGVQRARARTDKPEPGEAIEAGAYVDTIGLHHFRESWVFSDAAFVRFGFMGRLPNGSCGQSAAEVEMDVAVKLCGEVLGTKTVEIQPFVADKDQPAIVPITDWSPTIGVESVKAVFVLLDNQQDALEYQLVVRTAKDRMEPDAWVLVEGKSWSCPPAGNSERNTGELRVPAEARFEQRSLFQLGLAWRKRSGAQGSPRCLVHTLSHCRYT
jgi:hypothetical protein